MNRASTVSVLSPQWLGCVATGAAVCGYVNTHTDEVPFILASVLAMSALQGATSRRVWLAAVGGALVGAGVPLAGYVAMRYHLHQVWHFTPGDVRSSCVAIPAGIIAGLIAGGLRSALAPPPSAEQT